MRQTRLWMLAAIATIAGWQLACSENGRGTNDTGAMKPAVASAAPATQPADPIIARIRDEGLNRSKVMDTLDYLCNDIGPRLTGSPSCKRANEWTRETLESWGLSDAHLEAWGPFGRGWEVKRFSLQVTEPYAIILHGYPKAWSPGFDQPVEAPVIYLDAREAADLDKYKGKLKGAIVLAGAPRELQARFDPLARRMADEDLSKLASATLGTNALLGQTRDQTASERRAQFEASGAMGESLVNRRRAAMGDGAGPATAPSADAGSSTQPSTRPGARGGRRGFDPFASRILQFAANEGALLVITPSTQGDGGTFFVQSASIPGEQPRFGAGATTGPSTRPRVWSTSAPVIPPQVTLAVEDYNRIVRMIKRGETLKMAAEMQVQFNNDDPMAYNTVAEIPGSDLKDKIVMVGAHLDSWHSGTGATDNGVGSAAAMEAVRIIKALNLHPRRTIRVALWTGEEEGIYGSSAYVKTHFGYDPDPRASFAARLRRPDDPTSPPEAEQPTTRPARRIIKEADYDKLSVYFNLDNGTGKIRGIYAQGNDAAVPIFKRWLAPFADLGATTVTLANTGSTDHVSFDQVGLPGFQFIQDPIEYGSRTHHSNEDVYDRIQADDMKQASTIMAAFLWKAANMDARFPRKPLDGAAAR